jgi:hypothetical protein
VPPRLNGDQRSDSCRHESKPTKDYEVKIHPGRLSIDGDSKSVHH